MKQGESKVEVGTWVLAGLWATLLIAAPIFLSSTRRETRDMGFAVEHEATTPFSLGMGLGTSDMALPWATTVAFAIPLAVWLVLAAAIPALLLWKTRRLPHRADWVVDVIATTGFATTGAFLLIACMVPCMVLIE